MLNEPPVNVTSHSPSSEILSISWKYPRHIDGFLVMYREHYKSADPYKIYGTAGTNVTFTWLKPGTWYVFRIVPYETSLGNGIATQLFKVKTMEKRTYAFVQNNLNHNLF